MNERRESLQSSGKNKLKADERVSGTVKKNTSANPFTGSFVYIGVAVGLFLVLLGTAMLLFGKTPGASSLTICVGFGIVLAVFGTHVSGKWAGWSATGAGATALCLFLVLQQFTDVSVPNNFIKGGLEGDFSRVAEIRIVDEHPMYVYRDRVTSTIKFLTIGRKFKSKQLRIQVDTVEKELGREYFQLVADTSFLEERYFNSNSWDGEYLQLTFDYDARRVLDGNDIIFAERETIFGDLTPEGQNSFSGNFLVGSAHAGEVNKTGVLAQHSREEIERVINELRHDDVFRRRNARDQLVQIGPSVIVPMMQAFHASNEESVNGYRIQVGVTYVLSEMLRTDISLKKEISDRLRNFDFPALVRAASNPDKTIRYQAAEFLVLLQDSRSVASSLDAASKVKSDSIDNQIIILRESAKGLDRDLQNKIVEELAKSDRYNKTSSPDKAIRNIFKW